MLYAQPLDTLCYHRSMKKKAVWRPSRASKLSRFSLLSFAVFGAIYGVFLARNFGGTEAATALCYGRPGVRTVIAPATVTVGQDFKLTNLTATANSNIATVKSTTEKFKVSGASPATVSKTWTGPAQGDYTATYGDISLTATGAVGSKVSVTLTEITAQVDIAGVATTIVCSVENGQLTANNPGETLNLATINIVAPNVTASATLSPNSTSTKSSASSSTTSKSSSSSSSTAPTSSPTSSTSQTTSPTSTQESTVNSQQVAVHVIDHDGKPVDGAKVVLDSLPAKTTTTTGQATFANVIVDRHNLSVTANGHTITRELDGVDAPRSILGVQVQVPAPNRNGLKVAIGIGIGAALLVSFIIWLAARHHGKKPPTPLAEPPNTTNLPPTPPTTPSPPAAPTPPTVAPPAPPTSPAQAPPQGPVVG